MPQIRLPWGLAGEKAVKSLLNSPEIQGCFQKSTFRETASFMDFV
jgi:hypothetical protein